MVIAKLYGGLGNQMFQYAAGVGLASRLYAKLYTDLSWFEEIKGLDYIVSKREYELSVFGITPKQPGAIAKTIMSRKPPIVFPEKSTSYDSSFEKLEGNVILDGFWQSYKYFDVSESKVRSAFKFSEDISSYTSKVAKEVAGKNSVALHVRRGDYVSDKLTNDYLGALSLEYYKAAIKRLESRSKDLYFYVFSDDMEWCRKNLKLGTQFIFLDRPTKVPPHEDMLLMSSCKHNIIANSSFSWWAAWLNPSADKMVIAPKKWLASKNSNTKDRIPKEWTAL